MAAKLLNRMQVLVLKDPKRSLTIGTAVIVAVVFQAMTMARNNYSLWRLSFMGLELAVAVASSYAANAVKGLDARGAAWARSYLDDESSLLFKITAALPAAAARAGIMCACLSAVNATVVPVAIYRETIGNPVIAVIVRFLADIPQAVFLCLLVMLAIDHLVEREAEQQPEQPAEA